MKWFKLGAMYFSVLYLVWPKDAPPMCKYVIEKTGGTTWYLYQWDAGTGRFALIRSEADRAEFKRLYHAQERAEWLERRGKRAGAKADPTPVEAAQAAYETQMGEAA